MIYHHDCFMTPGRPCENGCACCVDDGDMVEGGSYKDSKEASAELTSSHTRRRPEEKATP